MKISYIVSSCANAIPLHIFTSICSTPVPRFYLTKSEDTTVDATTTTEGTTEWTTETTTTIDFDHSTESGWSTTEPEWMSRHISLYGADAPTPYRPNEKMVKQRAAKATESTPTQSTPFVISSTCNIL